ncbi:hypothetical protein [uncultured Nostoc sp.]|uniref:hypothetical protein n=1 Tax=uncultured Nostoc sp. TaxID=340711 RepID=UPI0026280651|nr:hypothetical protein [uncultured Nostoc sp.]
MGIPAHPKFTKKEKVFAEVLEICKNIFMYTQKFSDQIREKVSESWETVKYEVLFRKQEAVNALNILVIALSSIYFLDYIDVSLIQLFKEEHYLRKS